MGLAILQMRSMVATDVPPNFITRRAIGSKSPPSGAGVSIRKSTAPPPRTSAHSAAVNTAALFLYGLSPPATPGLKVCNKTRETVEVAVAGGCCGSLCESNRGVYRRGLVHL